MDMEVIDRVIADDLGPGDFIKVGESILPIKEVIEDGDFVNIIFEEEIDVDEEYGARFAWDDFVDLYAVV